MKLILITLVALVVGIMALAAVGCSPSESETAFDDGRILWELNRYEESIPHFTKAIAIDSKYTLAYLVRGSSYQELGRHKDAISDFDEGIRLDPNDSVWAYIDRGVSYSALGQYEDAVDDFNRAARLNSGYKEIYAFRGAAYSNLGESQKAIDDYTKALKKVDDDLSWLKAVYLYERGSAYKELGHQANADVDFANACSLANKFC